VDLSGFKKPRLSVSDYLVLGSLGLVDQGEMDWKVLAIEVNEAKEKQIKNLADFTRLYPGTVEEVREWFRNYKIPEGKGVNKFTADGAILSLEETLRVIHECSMQYRALKEGNELPGDKDHGFWLGNEGKSE